MRAHWTLDPEVTFLNHGSFGACPRVVLEFVAERWGAKTIRERNRVLVLEGRKRLCERLGVEPPAPASMIGSLAALPTRPGTEGATSGRVIPNSLAARRVTRPRTARWSPWS